MLSIGEGITGSNMLSIGVKRISFPSDVGGGVEEGTKIVNEDGSGDAIIFENGDNWITE